MSGDLQAALLERAKRERAKRQGAAPRTNMLEQSMSGVNEGIASLVGMPVDLMTAAMNAGITGLNNLTGSDIQEISNPVGGSQSIESAMGLLNAISEDEPQTLMQRLGRSVGREAGAMAIPTAAAIGKVNSIPKLLAFEGAAATGAGLGTETARQVVPDSQIAETIGGLAGGLTPFGITRAVRGAPQVPSMDDLRAQRDQAYQQVQSAGARITTDSRNNLIDQIRNRTVADDIDEFLHPKAARSVDRMDALPANPSIHDVEQKRQLIGRDVAGATEAGERRLGVAMKDEIDNYLRSLEAADVVGPDAPDAVDALQRGRELTQRIARAEEIGGDVGAVTKAIRRAATSGTGGNEVNAIRQNIRAILDNPKKRRGYSKDQIELMEAIVEGTPATNTLRAAGRLSPTAGALQQMTTGGLFAGAAMSGSPLLAVPPVAGYLAKAGAEGMTRRQVQQLDEMVRSGGVLPQSGASQEQLQALNASLLARLSEAVPQ